MPDRTIPCPVCRGLTLECPEGRCWLCGKAGTIPDRRTPTANDRAVERVKAICEEDMAIYKQLVEGGAKNIEYHHGSSRTAFTINRIIREEAER